MMVRAIAPSLCASARGRTVDTAWGSGHWQAPLAADLAAVSCGTHAAIGCGMRTHLVLGLVSLVGACATPVAEISKGGDAGGIGFDDAATADTGSCALSDMLVVLDRTMSMAYTPDGVLPADTPEGRAQSKWVEATDAVKQVTAAPNDQTVRFGLELFPLDQHDFDDSGADLCVELTTLLDKQGTPQNPACEPGEVVVPPGAGAGAAIASWLDPMSTRLCVSTPIAGALQTAAQWFNAHPTKNPVVVLVTDGGETCAGAPKDWAMSADVLVAQQLAQLGIKTYIIGFSAVGDGGVPEGGGIVGNDLFGVNTALLNDLACAGMTAANFDTACTQSGLGYIASDAKNGQLFTLAQDGAALQSAVQNVANGICCGCVK